MSPWRQVAVHIYLSCAQMKIQDPSVKPGFVNHGIERRIMVSPHKDLNAHSNLVDWKV